MTKARSRMLLAVVLVLAIVVSVAGAALAADRGAWAPNVSYAVNDTVTYNGSTYKCLQAHTSLTGWEPATTPALWQLVSGTPPPTTPPVTTPPPTTPPPGGLPSPWVTADVGAVGAAGSASYANPTFTVRGSGADVWGTVDEFRYVYRTWSGNVQITARVASLTNTNAWAKAGVMVREGTAAGSKHAFMAVTPTSGLAFQRRTATGGTSEHTGVGGAAPRWVRVLRSGSTLTGYVSTDGTNWTAVGTTTISMTTSVTVGLAVTSHADGTLATATFDNVSVITSGTPPPTTPPPVCTAVPCNGGTLVCPVGTTCNGGCGMICQMPTTPPPTTPPPSGSLPKHLITGYWQNFTGNGARALRLREVPTSYALVAVAFADATGVPGQVAFTLDPGLSSALGGYTATDFRNDIATLHGQGRKVIISVGGQNGTISVGDATAATNFANSVYNIMTSYGFDGVDIDLENGVNPQYMESALRQLRTRAGSNLIITMAPETIYMQSPSAAYLNLAIRVKDILTIVNTQYYNSGSMLGCNGQVYSQGSIDFITAQACIALQNGLRDDQVGLGLPANASGAGSGAVPPSMVNNALNCLARRQNCGSFVPAVAYPNIRGAMTWDVNWDANANWNFANTIYPFLGTLP